MNDVTPFQLPTASPAPVRTTLQALTGLRFVAALAVVLYHFVRVERGPWMIDALLGQGYVAVQFFFVLSGFILAYNYLLPGTPINRHRFWAARLARVYPLYLLGMLVALPFFARALTVQLGLSPLAAAGRIAAAVPPVLAMLQAWFPLRWVQLWNTPSWSLSSEAFFYLLFPFAGPLLLRLDRRGLYAALGAIWFATLLLHWMVLPLLPSRGGASGDPLLWSNVPLFHLGAFLTGIVFGLLFRREPPGRGGRLAPLLSVAVALALLVLLVFAGVAPDRARMLPLTDPLYGLLVFFVASGRGPLAWLASQPPLVLLGEASYALYMLHAPVWGYFQAVASRVLGWNSASMPFEVAYVVVAVAASVAAHLFIERPAREWMRRRCDRSFSR